MSGKCGPTLVAVADAAPDNWTFLERLRPDEQAVDFFHACEHLSEVADRRDRLVRQVSRRATLASTRLFGHYLRDRATTKTAIAVLERELRFFRRHRCRMRYASLKVGGYTIGSGVVEAANKVLVNQRMKRARWSVAGGQNVLTFRALLMSGRFDAAWRAIPGGANDSLNAA